MHNGEWDAGQVQPGRKPESFSKDVTILQGDLNKDGNVALNIKPLTEVSKIKWLL